MSQVPAAVTELTTLMRTEQYSYNELLSYVLGEQNDAQIFWLIKEKETFVKMEKELVPQVNIKSFAADKKAESSDEEDFQKAQKSKIKKHEYKQKRNFIKKSYRQKTVKVEETKEEEHTPIAAKKDKSERPKTAAHSRNKTDLEKKDTKKGEPPVFSKASKNAPKIDSTEFGKNLHNIAKILNPNVGRGGQLIEPSKAPEFNNKLPNKGLELDYVIGYNQDVNENLYFNKDGALIYVTASIGVKLDPKTNKQQFFGAGEREAVKGKGHLDDIDSIDICSHDDIIATGGRGKNPDIYVWQSTTMELITTFNQGIDTRSVALIKFDPTDKFLYTVDSSNIKQLRLWDIKEGKCIAEISTGEEVVTDMDASNGEFKIVLVGKHRLLFFKQEEVNGKIQFQMKSGITTGNKGKTFNNDPTCVTFFKGKDKAASGTVAGEVYIWEKNKAIKSYRIHEGYVSQITVQDDIILTAGSKDKTLKIWDGDATFKVSKQGYQFGKRIVAVAVKGEQVAIATNDGTVHYLEDGQIRDVMQSHHTGETWGLSHDCKANVIITTGDDNKVLVFDPQSNKITNSSVINTKRGDKKSYGASTSASTPPNYQSRCIAINEMTGHVAICQNDGNISIRNAQNDLDTIVKKIDYAGNANSRWIESAAYSPDGKHLAIGNHDMCIYVYGTVNYRLQQTLTKWSSAIIDFDWCKESKYIRGFSQAYELLYYDAVKGTHIVDGYSLRDTEWNTNSCKQGYSVTGIWGNPSYEGTDDINNVATNEDQNLLATGDDQRLVNLFNYPAVINWKNVKETPPCRSYKAHSEHVINVVFDDDNQFLYTVGGEDKTICKWRIVDEKVDDEEKQEEEQPKEENKE